MTKRNQTKKQLYAHFRNNDTPECMNYDLFNRIEGRLWHDPSVHTTFEYVEIPLERFLKKNYNPVDTRSLSEKSSSSPN